MLLGHLIALISNAHLESRRQRRTLAGTPRLLLPLGWRASPLERPVCIEIDPTELAVSELRSPTPALRRACIAHPSAPPMPGDGADCHPAPWAYPFFTMSRKPLPGGSGTWTLRPWTLALNLVPLVGSHSSGPTRRVPRVGSHASGPARWWSQTGSNRRP